MLNPTVSECPVEGGENKAAAISKSPCFGLGDGEVIQAVNLWVRSSQPAGHIVQELRIERTGQFEFNSQGVLKPGSARWRRRRSAGLPVGGTMGECQ